MELYVNGIGTLGPGLAGWAGSRAVLAGESPSCETTPPEPSASLLPPNERRRSSESVRWALHVAQEAMQQAEADAREVTSVFASSDGETGVLDRLCTALAMPQRTISPTLFHHSVHNAASGYWGIATGSQRQQCCLVMILPSVPPCWRRPPMCKPMRGQYSSWPMIYHLPLLSMLRDPCREDSQPRCC
jgi:hypothetical protein